MRYAILHFSDLHRDLDNEVGNVALIESLARDMQRFDQQQPRIELPTLCIASGDFVYGVQPGRASFASEVERQYHQAEEFLGLLADRCFGGNRDRVVILPGNHDVCYNTVLASMERIGVPAADMEKRRLVADLFRPGSKLRWSWGDLCFYRISDADKYLRRLESFATFYKQFYLGKRTFGISPEEQFAVFRYPDIHLSVLALNSCHNNDPLRRAGALDPACVAMGLRVLGGAEHIGHLAAAAWHHGLFAVPYQDDYVDAGVLQVLIDAGVSLGFHGHQHRSRCIEERCRFGQEGRKITIVSSGTLCAGPGSLPPGEPRCYNVVEIDSQSWSGRLHQRQMVNADFALPIWGPGHFSETNKSYLDFSICPPASLPRAGLQIQLALEQAERCLGMRRWAEALDLLRPIAAVPLARPLLIRALSELGDPHRTLEMLWPPSTTVEIVMVGAAIVEAGTRDQASSFVNLEPVSNAQDVSVRDIARRVRERRLQ